MLTVRLHACADLQLAITERVWRGSKPRKGSSMSGKPFDSPLKAEYTTFVHLVLLQHRGADLYKATSHSEAVFVDPHSMDADLPTVLYESRLPLRRVSLSAVRQIQPAFWGSRFQNITPLRKLGNPTKPTQTHFP